MKYQDDTVIDIDTDTVKHSLLVDHNNESMNDNILKIMRKTVHDSAYLSNLKQQDIPKGIRQVQIHPEKDLIMKVIDLELQVSVQRSQCLRHSDPKDNSKRNRDHLLMYSHVVFDKKYKIDPETKRNVFLKWKASLVFDGHGNKQKSYEGTFSDTPSLLMIRNLNPTS